MPYERNNIASLTAYTPGEQPRRGEVVKLNTNENPYPPCEAVMEAVRGVPADALRRYPPPTAQAFRELAAKVHGLLPEQVIATNGGDELLRMAVTAFCRPRPGTLPRNEHRPSEPGGPATPGGLGQTDPTYSLYDVLADIHDTPVTRVPLDGDWSIPHDFADRVLACGCTLVLVVNPHAPSGRSEPIERLADIARSLRGRAVLLIDEAYVNFAPRDAVPLLLPAGGLDNVLLLRSLSKGYSLAGLRFGYGLGHPDLIAALDKCRDSYNTDALAQAAALAALTHRERAADTWHKVIAERRRLTDELRRRGWTLPDSHSNFLLATPPSAPGRPAAPAILAALKDRQIFVRYFDQPRLRDKLRITIGTPAQNDSLLQALDSLA